MCHVGGKGMNRKGQRGVRFLTVKFGVKASEDCP